MPHPSSTEIRLTTFEDLPAVDRIFRTALGTFNGMENPMDFSGDAAVVRCRKLLYPETSLVAVQGETVVGSNFISHWGSLGLFGPLTVEPSLWNQGIARRLLDATMERFEELGVTQRGIFTFVKDTKHVVLYRRYGYYPQYLHFIMARNTPEWAGSLPAVYSDLNAEQKAEIRAEIRKLTDSLLPGLDLTREVEAVDEYGWGDVVLLMDADRLDGFAICHAGKDTEAGSDIFYIKFGAAVDAGRYDDLLTACESLARQRGLGQVWTGVNLAREGVYSTLLNRGYEVLIPGVSMQAPNRLGYNRSDAFVMDDWR